MRWLRLYDEIIDDPKVLQLSHEFRWNFVQILCIANRNSERGSLPDLRQCAIHMRMTLKKATRVIDELMRLGFIDKSKDGKGLEIHNWHKRQFKSDDITARTAESKERSRERSQVEERERSQIQRQTTETDSVCVSRTREGDDLRDWEEALEELQGDPTLKLIGDYLRDSASVPSVAGLDGWRFLHAAHVLRGRPEKATWNFFEAVARRASRREFDAWHSPPVKEHANGTGGPSNGRHETPEQAKRRRIQEWANS